MELDKAFKLAVIFTREDLMNVTQLCSARVEYQREPETSLDYLSVWLVRAGGLPGSGVRLLDAEFFGPSKGGRLQE